MPGRGGDDEAGGVEEQLGGRVEAEAEAGDAADLVDAGGGGGEEAPVGVGGRVGEAREGAFLGAGGVVRGFGRVDAEDEQAIVGAGPQAGALEGAERVVADHAAEGGAVEVAEDEDQGRAAEQGAEGEWVAGLVAERGVGGER